MKKDKSLLRKLRVIANTNPAIIRLSHSDMMTYRKICQRNHILSIPKMEHPELLTYRGIEVIENKGFIL